MYRAVGYISVLLTVWCMLSSSAEAQQVSCANAPAMQNVNVTQFVGTWYEVARNPNVTNMGCIEIDLGLMSDNNTLGINVTYVDPQTTVWENLTVTASITINLTNTDGYNVSYSVGAVSQPIRTLKLLNTDYSNYAIVCGYTNASDASTALGAVLTRVRNPNAADLTSYEQTANKSYFNFDNMALIAQSDKCYRSGALTSLPMLASTLAVMYALLKYIF